MQSIKPVMDQYKTIGTISKWIVLVNRRNAWKQMGLEGLSFDSDLKYALKFEGHAIP